MNVDKDIRAFFCGEPPGQRPNAIRWLQKKVMARAVSLPRSFASKSDGESFKSRMRRELPKRIGIPSFPALGESVLRGRVRLGEDLECERLDVFVDEDYAIPGFLYRPLSVGTASGARLPALLWNGGARPGFLSPGSLRCARIRPRAHGLPAR